MSFLKKLFGKTDQEKEVANDQARYPVRNLEKEGYINLGRSIFPLVRNKNESKFTMQMPPGSELQTFDTKGEKNPDGAPFFRIILDGTYDASLLIGQNFLEKMKEVVKDEVIAFAAPRTDVLLLSPVSNKLTLAQMARTAGSLFINAANENNNTALSNQILIRKNGQWTAIENSPDEFYLKISDF